MFTNFGQNTAAFHDNYIFLNHGLFIFVRIWIETTQISITSNGKWNYFFSLFFVFVFVFVLLRVMFVRDIPQNLSFSDSLHMINTKKKQQRRMTVRHYEAVLVPNLSENFLFLSRSNEKLSRSNENLSRSNEKLSRSNEKLSRSNEKVSRSNEKLSRSNEKLSRSNEKIISF